MEKYQEYCGCCGREIPHGEWCLPCSKHLSQDRSLSMWDRTYFAQHGKECPYQVTSEATA